MQNPRSIPLPKTIFQSFLLVHLAQRLAADTSATMPKWWIVKDDDTYVNVDNLYLDLSTRNATDLAS